MQLFNLRNRNFSRDLTQCLKFPGSDPLYQISVLSTFSIGGRGRKPSPTKNSIFIIQDRIVYWMLSGKNQP